ncbi:7-deoxyloganetic acid glucosyl transferase-like [Ipomoea triloba]|uniref:7-deoxyloganetic acid glucosyl transferase-like n=1 Tax=Ipomoea triloba TaxID=35885 RepID=UPI00125D15DD|nr:7-deoxyloganetic acid glucosyl transferase-like [Ipomoea triloba]
MAENLAPQFPPHVLLFPFPFQGHITPMLHLAELLSLGGLHVTFINTLHNHNRLFSNANFRSHFSRRYAGFRFEAVSDGLPEDQPRSEEKRLLDIHASLRATAKPFLKELLMSSSGGRGAVSCVIVDGILGFVREVAEDLGVPVIYFRTVCASAVWTFFSIPNLIQAKELPFQVASRGAVSCVIVDGILGFVREVAEDLGVPVIYFRTVCASAVWTFFSIPNLIQAKELPFQAGNDMDKPVGSVEGMEDFLRRCDLPTFCQVDDLSAPSFQFVRSETKHPRTIGLILNTFEDLEKPMLDHIRARVPNLYAIGPFHAHLRAKLEAQSIKQYINLQEEEDRSCMEWLDRQPDKSVIYVSLGSLITVSRETLMELWHGLVNSGQRFLWVIRRGSVTNGDGGDQFVAEIKEKITETAYIVGWAPQKEVLSHRAVGGFLTHSGWNSTLESIICGVPMICWPHFADQPVNARMAETVWKLGLNIKSSCDRVDIEKKVRDLMEVRRDEFIERAEKMAKLAKQSVGKGGSSWCYLDRLIKDISCMATKKSIVHETAVFI